MKELGVIRMNELTIQWIIETLKKEGCNSKKIVIDRLSNLSEEDLDALLTDVCIKNMETRKCKNQHVRNII